MVSLLIGAQHGGAYSPEHLASTLANKQFAPSPAEHDHYDYLDAWRALEAFHRQGLVRHLGVSNFNRAQLERLLANAELAPEVLQVRYAFHVLACHVCFDPIPPSPLLSAQLNLNFASPTCWLRFELEVYELYDCWFSIWMAPYSIARGH